MLYYNASDVNSQLIIQYWFTIVSKEMPQSISPLTEGSKPLLLSAAGPENCSTKKFLLIAEYTNFELEYLEKYQGEIVGAIVPFIVYNEEFFNKGVISCDLHEENNFLLIEDLHNFYSFRFGS